MKMLAYGLACAAVLTLAVPANAQIRIGDRDSGVSVRIGDGDRHHSRHHSRHHHRHYVRESYAGCRVIKTRTHRPNGTVVIKTRRVCN